MNIEKWESIKNRIKDDFAVEDDGKESYEEDGGVEIEYLIFASPLGRVKLEFITRPVVLDKKTKYSNRIGSQTEVEYVYSATEKSSKLQVWRWDETENDWLALDEKTFNL